MIIYLAAYLFVVIIYCIFISSEQVEKLISVKYTVNLKFISAEYPATVDLFSQNELNFETEITKNI